MQEKLGKIRDVAREAGLSTATVSRVMNGNPKVNTEMRTRVLEAAKKLNYVPNPAARALSTAKSKTVATIIPNIEHSVYAKYITAVQQTLSELGYTLVLAISNADPQEELAAAEQLVLMGAEAFILTGADHSDALMELLQRRSIPVIFTSTYDTASATPTIGYDNKKIAADAVRYLQELGHRHIAIVHGPCDLSDRTVARCKGCVEAAWEDTKLHLVEDELSVEGGRKAASKILELDEYPTVILCLSDVLSMGVMFQLQSIGLTVPDDISVMGFDNLDWSKDSHPSLTTIDLPAAKMGETAVRQLVNQLDNGIVVTSIELQAEIIKRNSVIARTECTG